MAMDVFELKRQAFHFFLGLSIVLLFRYNILTARLLFLILIMGILLSVICSRHHVPGISWLLGRFERKKAKFPGQGAIFFVLGCFTVIGLFPAGIASASIMVLAPGDSLSTLIGKNFGKHRMGSKSVEGTVAGIAAGFAGALFFVPLTTAFLGSFIAMLAEAIDIELFGKVVDDNLLVPIVSAFVMYGITLL